MCKRDLILLIRSLKGPILCKVLYQLFPTVMCVCPASDLPRNEKSPSFTFLLLCVLKYIVLESVCVCACVRVTVTKIAIFQLPIRSSAAEIHFVLLQQLLEVLTTGVTQKQTSNLIYVVSLNLVCRSALWFTSFVPAWWRTNFTPSCFFYSY